MCVRDVCAIYDNNISPSLLMIIIKIIILYFIQIRQTDDFPPTGTMLVMYKASKFITTAGMYTLYCSLFQPHISYGNEFWGNTYASNVNCLCIIQRKVVRLICNANRLAHTNELFKELYILKFPEFVQYNTAILMFHLFHGTLPIHLQNRFSRYSTTRSTL